MKKALVLGILVVCLIIAYLKFKGGGDVGEVVAPAPTPPTPTPSGPPAVTPPKAAVAVDDRLPLIDAATLAKFNTLSPDQLTDPTKTDLVVEISDGTGSVPSLRLADAVVLDGSSLQAGSGKVGYLVHLRAAQGGSVQGAADPEPASLDQKLQKQVWRAPQPVSQGPSDYVITTKTVLWASEFRDRQASLKGKASVEGTFDSFQRGAANAKFESVTLKELGGVKFNFPKGSPQSAEAAAAEA
ncbi:MAG: hypothetical protein HY000_11175, partial [Planctomycetes bacterium]|nr:hypothetical protein [Planctomycetota bacterium]